MKWKHQHRQKCTSTDNYSQWSENTNTGGNARAQIITASEVPLNIFMYMDEEICLYKVCLINKWNLCIHSVWYIKEVHTPHSMMTWLFGMCPHGCWGRHLTVSLIITNITLHIQKVTGSIPDGVIGIFHWHNPSNRTMALGLTQPLKEMSTRRISWG